LNSLTFSTAKSARALFAFEDTEYLLEISATAPGVFRLRCATASVLEDEKPSARAQAHAQMLLARPDPISELAVASVPGKQGWRVEQGEMVLELSTDPFQLNLYRGEELVLRTADQTLEQLQANEEP